MSEKSTFIDIAREHWGADLPDWVETLAREADRKNASSVANRLGYSGAVISGVLRNKYPGDIAAVEGKVRGVFLGAVVECPVLGEIGRHSCLAEQKMGNTGTSSLRTRLFHACRSGCPHSRLEGGADA